MSSECLVSCTATLMFALMYVGACVADSTAGQLVFGLLAIFNLLIALKKGLDDDALRS